MRMILLVIFAVWLISQSMVLAAPSQGPPVALPGPVDGDTGRSGRARPAAVRTGRS
jgi:hypothetical protein